MVQKNALYQDKNTICFGVIPFLKLQNDTYTTVKR